MNKKYTKEEVIKIVTEARSKIEFYESGMWEEERILVKVQDNCPHEYVPNPIGEGVICILCEHVLVEGVLCIT